MAYIRGGRYVYRSKRTGDKVKSEYIGPASSPLMESILTLEKLEREKERADKQKITDQALFCQDEIERLFDETTEVMKQALDEAGYHQHDRGEWRKRKMKDDREQ